jgi:hypothetical protein
MSRNAFAVTAEIDGAEIEDLNRRLRRLSVDRAGKAMKNGFRTWGKRYRQAVMALAPYGRSSPTEVVRGEVRPNPHIRDMIAVKVRGYRKGEVIWAAVGVKEVPGSYTTPHWYLRWVEFGHVIKRKSTEAEAILLKSRGYTRKKEYGTIAIGNVPGKFFMAKALVQTQHLLLPMVEDALASQIEKEMTRGK